MRSQGKLLLSKLERPPNKYRESQLSRTETHELKPLWEPISGRKSRIIIDKLLKAQRTSLRVKNPKEHSTRGKRAQFYKFYLQEYGHSLKVNIKEKSPHVSGRGRGKGTILKYLRALCS